MSIEPKELASVLLDDEAGSREIALIVKNTDQGSLIVEESWHGYSLLRELLRSPKNGLHPPDLSSDFLAGVRAGIARLPKKDQPVSEPARPYGWLWNWGMQPLALAASLALLVIIGINVTTNSGSYSTDYAQNDERSELNPIADRGSQLRPNSSADRLNIDPQVEFVQSRLHAYKLKHANRNAVGIASSSFLRMAAYSDSQQ